jgi:hypothetical protein
MASLIVSALSTWSNKGLKKAEKDVSAFDKTVKNVGKTFAAVFSAQAIISFGKASVKAFMDDEKAAKALEVQLNNLGYSYSVPGVELYIANLQKMYGVMDDQLRPAFQTLITASGSLTQSQKALDVALNVSAATGKSVQEVSAALAKGFSGQTTALTRLGAGLDKATLASGDMNKIMDALSEKFSGQASARLDTYAGKMDLLTVATANFKEEIGKGILDALSVLGNDKSIETATDQMDAFGKSIGDAIYGTGLLIGKLNSLVSTAGGGGLVKLLVLLSPGGLQASRLFDYLSTTGANERSKSGSTFTYEIWDMAGIQARAKELELLKKRNQANAALLAKEKAKLALGELEKKFDVERIGLMAALNAATDDETKLRLKAQLAILDNNAALATKYNAELEAARKAKELAAALGDAATTIGVSAKDLAAYLASGRSVSVMPATYAGSGATLSNEAATFAAEVVSRNVYDKLDRMDMGFSSSSTSSRSGTPEITVNLNAGGSIMGLEEVDAAIQDALLRIYRQNGDLTPAGTIL